MLRTPVPLPMMRAIRPDPPERGVGRRRPRQRGRPRLRRGRPRHVAPDQGGDRASAGVRPPFQLGSFGRREANRDPDDALSLAWYARTPGRAVGRLCRRVGASLSQVFWLPKTNLSPVVSRPLPLRHGGESGEAWGHGSVTPGCLPGSPDYLPPSRVGVVPDG